MKDVLIISFLAIAIFAGIVFSFIARTPVVGPGLAAEPQAAAASSEAAPKPQKNKNEPPNLLLSQKIRTEPQPPEDMFIEFPDTPVEHSLVKPPLGTKAAEPVFDYGKLRQVTPGMSSERVVDLLGKPTLSTITVDRVGVRESYVYSNSHGERLAVIRFLDGVVSSASR